MSRGIVGSLLALHSIHPEPDYLGASDARRQNLRPASLTGKPDKRSSPSTRVADHSGAKLVRGHRGAYEKR